MRIAIVGSGVSGLVCAHLLRRVHEITLFEAAHRIGGHAHTLDVEVEGERHAVDVGFIVYNERTYPSFTRLLASLGVATRESDMSFGVACERTGLEWGSHGLGALFDDGLVRHRHAPQVAVEGRLVEACLEAAGKGLGSRRRGRGQVRPEGEESRGRGQGRAGQGVELRHQAGSGRSPAGGGRRPLGGGDTNIDSSP